MAKSGVRKGTVRPAPLDKPVRMKPDRIQLGLIKPLKERKNSRLESAGRWLSQPVPANPFASSRSPGDEAADAFERFADRRGLDLPARIEILHALLANHDARLPRPKVVPLPTTAPEAWSKRDLNLRENPVQYTRRVYAPWFGHGLTRKDLKALDPELYRALSVWVSRHPDDAITELPAQSEIMDELIDRLSAQLSLDDLRKLGYAIDTRLRRASKK